MNDTPSQRQILIWMGVLEDYARDWDQTFGQKTNYFTQEFWYLLVGCTVAAWEGKPLTVSSACQSMKSGSNRTREERIKRAVADGYLSKQKSTADGREASVLPTPRLESMIVGHFQRTLKLAIERLADCALE